MKITIGITATKRYLHASDILARRIKANLANINRNAELIVVTDETEEADKLVGSLIDTCAKYVTPHIIKLPIDDDKQPYKTNAQLLIAQMENAAFEKARDLNADFFWSVEPDVLPPPNALRCLIDTLNFDGGYYDVAMVTYPSQGGGSFLGGRGTARNWILQDIYEDERALPEDLKKRKGQLEAKAQREHNKNGKITKKTEQECKKLHEQIQACPPKGNIFELQAKGWRRRGWLGSAYPGLGRGCVLPTDWVGMGCTLLSKKALELAHFEGYRGAGTQDLFLCWKRWFPEGLKFSVITHVACEHIVRATKDDFSEFNLLCPEYAEDGECVGHLRMRTEPYYTFKGGEVSVDKSDK